jgi:hypothetical protein
MLTGVCCRFLLTGFKSSMFSVSIKIYFAFVYTCQRFYYLYFCPFLEAFILKLNDLVILRFLPSGSI